VHLHNPLEERVMTKRLGRILATSFAALALAVSPAAATTITYSLTMTGAQEVPTAADPDGTGVGTLTVNDSTGLISWALTYANIVAPSAMHIHGPSAPVGVGAGVFVGLGVVTTGGAGTLINSTTTSLANALAINTLPANFYLNIHNATYPGGAIRGQLGTVVPEPGTFALLALGLFGLAGAGRQRS
jgi:hypothetical protein